MKEKYSVEKYGDIIDFNWVHEGWTSKLEGTYASDEQSVYRRVKDIFRWCRDGQDSDDGEEGRREIVIVTHASILTHFGRKFYSFSSLKIYYCFHLLLLLQTTLLIRAIYFRLLGSALSRLGHVYL